jgi:hypothetical protein
MQTEVLQQIQKRLAELPADVQAAIQSAELEEHIKAIGAKNNLHIDQIGELGDETLLAMLGFSPLENFSKRLSDALHLELDAAERLAADVNTEVFGTIRESMKKFALAGQAAAPTPTVAAPAVPPAPPIPAADVMLSEKTVSVGPIPYKADPYREPV